MGRDEDTSAPAGPLTRRAARAIYAPCAVPGAQAPMDRAILRIVYPARRIRGREQLDSGFIRADTAGGMMTPDFPRVRSDVTAGNALDALRLFGEDAEGFGWVCVVDRGQRLTGYVSIAQLALSSPTRTVQDLADQYDHRLVSVPPEMDQEEVHRIMSRYSFSIVPVVDAEERVLGVIRAEEAMRVAEDEATEDMLRIASAPGERVFGPLHLSVRHRLPWLVLNLGTVLLAAAVVNLFESTIAAIAMLAVFLPVVAGQGGIDGFYICRLERHGG